MKRYFVLLLLIFVGGALFIALPRIIPTHIKDKDMMKIQEKEQAKKEIEDTIQSSIETIQDPEHVQQLTELYDPAQMYFENIEVLYDYLKFGHIETVKQKIQFFIHNNIDPNILDCRLEKESLISDGNKITFDVTYEGGVISVLINILDDGESVDISVFDSVK